MGDSGGTLGLLYLRSDAVLVAVGGVLAVFCLQRAARVRLKYALFWATSMLSHRGEQ